MGGIRAPHVDDAAVRLKQCSSVMVLVAPQDFGQYFGISMAANIIIACAGEYQEAAKECRSRFCLRAIVDEENVSPKPIRQFPATRQKPRSKGVVFE